MTRTLADLADSIYTFINEQHREHGRIPEVREIAKSVRCSQRIANEQRYAYLELHGLLCERTDTAQLNNNDLRDLVQSGHVDIEAARESEAAQ